jgi:gluconolactonase
MQCSPLFTSLSLSLVLLFAPSRAWGQTPPVEHVASVHVVMLEGPAAHPDGTVYFTDMINDRILKLGTDGKTSTFRHPANRPNGLVLDAQFNLLAAERGDPEKKTSARITRTDLKTGRVEVLADAEKWGFGVPNDVTWDAKGRIYFTSGGEVYRLDADGRVTKIAASPLVQGANGLVLSLDDRTLYLVEINRGAGEPRRIRAFDVSPEGSLSNPRVLFDFSPGRGGDGMAIDQEGNFYVAAGMNQLRDTSETLLHPSGVYVFSPKGSLLQRIPVPQDTMTNVAFGGPDLRTLYVTAGNTLFKLPMKVAGTRR